MARQRADVQNADLQHTIDQNEHLQQSLDSMQAHLQELEERVDFAEPLLTKHRDADRLGQSPG